MSSFADHEIAANPIAAARSRADSRSRSPGLRSFRGPDRRCRADARSIDVAVRGAVVDIVSARGLRVHSAGCGHEALRILLSQPVDLTILDFEMPDMTGLEVVRRYLSGTFVARRSGPPVRRPAPGAACRS